MHRIALEVSMDYLRIENAFVQGGEHYANDARMARLTMVAIGISAFLISILVVLGVRAA